MENLELTFEEQIEIERRGFFVKEVFTFTEILKSIYSTVLITSFLGGIGYIFFEATYVTYFMLCVFPMLSIIPLYEYIFSSSLFYKNHGIIGFGKNSTKGDLESKIKRIGFFGNIVKIWWKYIDFSRSPILFLRSSGKNKENGSALIIFITLILVIIGTTHFHDYFMDSQIITGEDYAKFGLIYLLYGLGIGSIVSIVALGLNILINLFHPLYAFGNLGEKIQKLTPRIEEQSKQIQSEFSSDMNFSTLSAGFDSLSNTFSKIVGFVIKLEKVEARANKGNLFDSEKYINSLRLDIIEPLKGLKGFLEKQKMDLMNSQKELTRVRVGGEDPEINSGGQENIELQSKRSESLIMELTENIEKLDVMIGKMGK